MPKLQKYFISDVDADKFYFRSTAGLYQSIGSTVTGIYPATDNELDAPEFSVKSLLKKGLLLRLSATAVIGSKRRAIDILCNRLVLTTIFDAAIDKNFTITGGASGQIKQINQALKQISRG